MKSMNKLFLAFVLLNGGGAVICSEVDGAAAARPVTGEVPEIFEITSIKTFAAKWGAALGIDGWESKFSSEKPFPLEFLRLGRDKAVDFYTKTLAKGSISTNSSLAFLSISAKSGRGSASYFFFQNGTDYTIFDHGGRKMELAVVAAAINDAPNAPFIFFGDYNLNKWRQ